MQNPLHVMNKLRTWVLYAIALLLLMMALLFIRPGFNAGKAGERDFRIGTEEQPVRIEIRHPGAEDILLEKKEDGQWLLNEVYDVNEQAMIELLAALRQAEVRRPVPAARRTHIAEQLHDSALSVKVYTRRHWLNLPGDLRYFPREQLLRHYLILDGDIEESSSIMRLANADMPYEVHLPFMPVSIMDVLPADKNRWRTPYVAQLSPMEIKRLEAIHHKVKEESYVWEMNEEAGFVLFDHEGERISPDSIITDRMAPYFHQFQRLRYERLVSGPSEEAPPDMLSGDAFYSLIIEDSNGEKIILEFFKRIPPEDGTLILDETSFDPNRFYLRINEQEYALAQYVIFQPVIRSLSWFLGNDDHLSTFFE